MPSGAGSFLFQSQPQNCLYRGEGRGRGELRDGASLRGSSPQSRASALTGVALAAGLGQGWAGPQAR